MKHSQRAIMTSVDHLNENFEVKVNRCPTAFEDDSDSSVLFSLPKDKFSDYFEVGDLIEFKSLGSSSLEIANLSCKVLRPAKFKRELNSILRRLDDHHHPLKRCILLTEDSLVLLSVDKNTEELTLLKNQQKNLE
ncbi:MAG: hypothetical protein ACI92O_000250 [Colwellia sp.]|jgi:hypothetical protein